MNEDNPIAQLERVNKDLANVGHAFMQMLYGTPPLRWFASLSRYKQKVILIILGTCLALFYISGIYLNNP